MVVVNTSLVHLTEEQKSILKNVMIIEVDATDIAIDAGSSMRQYGDAGSLRETQQRP